MLFKAFLQLSCQLVDSPYAKVSIEGREVEFHTSQATWQISSKLSMEGGMHPAFMGLLRQSIIKRWGLSGVHFQCDPADGSILLSQKCSPLDSLVKFKSAIDQFFLLVSEWEGAMGDLPARQEIRLKQN